ncbi:hypothetical protein [Methanobrevibacter sp. DSM 116169]|uniref:hypothetical protein n=1 Tax=Methanobrevibacter sp. DSM 116169 TaxID=3242727 RepID=UPI0038FC68F4
MRINFSKIMNDSVHTLNPIELVIHLIIISFILTFCSFFAAGMITSSSNANPILVFLGCECILFSYWIAVFSLKFLNKHFDMFEKDNPNKNTFEGWIIGLMFYGVGFFFCLTIIFHAFGNYIVGMGIGLVFVFPQLVMFFRRKTCFNERSRIISNEISLGYEPRHYWLLGLICGFATIGFGFFSLGSYLSSGNPPLIFCLIVIILSFMIISLILSPDLMNKKLPFEIRKNNGFNYYFVLCIIFCLIFAYIVYSLWGLLLG